MYLPECKRWTGTYFEDIQLRDIGFRIVIGHEVGSCPCPGPPIEDFTVVNTSGLHIIPVSFCQCLGHPHIRIQLLRSGWFPASLGRPRSAFTFDCLETFQLLNLQGKLSAHDYCKALDQISDIRRHVSHESSGMTLHLMIGTISCLTSLHYRIVMINSSHAHVYGVT